MICLRLQIHIDIHIDSLSIMCWVPNDMRCDPWWLQNVAIELIQWSLLQKTWVLVLLLIGNKIRNWWNVPAFAASLSIRIYATWWTQTQTVIGKWQVPIMMYLYSIPIVFDTGVGGVCVSVGMIPRNTIVSQNDGSSCTEDERWIPS